MRTRPMIAALAIALASASISTVAAAPAASAVTVVRTTTSVSLDNINRTFDVGTVAMTGTFLNAKTHVGIAGAFVQLWSHPISGGVWTHIADTRTVTAGRFTVNINATTSLLYQARFTGTASWAPSATGNVRVNVVKVGTRITAPTVSALSVGYGGGTDVRGAVIDARNHPVTGQRVELWSAVPGAAWLHTANETTSSTGSYVFSPRSLTKTSNYQVRFPATVKWTASVAPGFPVTVARSNTTVTAALRSTAIGYGETETISGSVTDALHKPMPAQRVEIWSQAVGSTWINLGVATTNSAGAYSFDSGELLISTSFQARYAASTYLNAASSVVVKTAVQVVTWSINPKLAADTAAAVNVYRVSKGLKALVILPTSAVVDRCVAQNSTGVICDPGVLASGFLTGPAVVKAWKVSPEHNNDILGDIWGHIMCAAYTASDGMSSNVGCATDF